MKKEANISFVLLAALLTVCSGAAVLNIAASSKYKAKSEYERIASKYISESSIDLALGLFINYIGNRDLTVTYEKDESGHYYISEEFSPYILDEIEEGSDGDEIFIEIVSNEAKDYLASIGYLDYKKDSTVNLFVNTFGNSDGLKITNMCIEPNFLISADGGIQRSKLRPVYLTVKATYPGGNILTDIKLSNLFAERGSFSEISEGYGNAAVKIDTSDAEIEFENYQNYGGKAL